jgi:hypothetical protein
MSTTAKVTLPGIEYIGMPYDIRRQYASATSVNLGAPLFTITNANSFDPDTDPSVKIQIHQQDYYYPKDQFTVGTLNLQNTTQVEFTDAKEYSDKFSFGVEAGYQKAMFGGSVTSNFSASYDSSAYMVSVSRWALIRRCDQQIRDARAHEGHFWWVQHVQPECFQAEQHRFRHGDHCDRSQLCRL